MSDDYEEDSYNLRENESSLMSWLMLIYFGVGGTAVAITVGTALVPVATAVVTFIAAHQLAKDISYSVVFAVLKAMAMGKSPKQAAVEAGIDTATLGTILAGLRHVKASGKFNPS